MEFWNCRAQTMRLRLLEAMLARYVATAHDFPEPRPPNNALCLASAYKVSANFWPILASMARGTRAVTAAAARLAGEGEGMDQRTRTATMETTTVVIAISRITLSTISRATLLTGAR